MQTRKKERYMDVLLAVKDAKDGKVEFRAEKKV
jgi:ribosomal protein L1